MNPENLNTLLTDLLAGLARDEEDLDDALACNLSHAAQNAVLHVLDRRAGTRATLAELRHRLACGSED